MKSLSKSIIFSIALIFSISAVAQTYIAPGSAGSVELKGGNVTIGGVGTFTFSSLNLKNAASLTIPAGVVVIVTGAFENKASSVVNVDGELFLNGADNENKGEGVIDGMGRLYAPNGITNKGGATIFGNSSYSPGCAGGCAYSTLPVELLSFDASFENNVKITWSTATEVNNEYFSLERSEDGVEFYEIARIEGNGNSTEVIEYAFEDDSYKSEVEYYRLTQVDFDGQYEVFKAIRVETNMGQSENSFNVYPTVVTQGKVTIEGDKPFQVKDIQVISLTGSSNVFQPATSEVGFRNVEVDMNGVQNGLYLLKMVSEDGNEMTSRIIVK
ncbi:MAG: T9SS type A sorting domain-containing protein [Cyclobacteriaceae bacterium]|nr:T9SS type A sorting domain-containing protein [Cyclobacteriaceae bacterium SS2]